MTEPKENLAINNQFAVKHGIYAKFHPPTAGKLDNDLYEEIIANLTKEYKPKKATDKLLVQQVAFLFIRLNRINRYCSDLESQHQLKDDEAISKLDLNTVKGMNDYYNIRLSRYHNHNRNDLFKRVLAEEGHIWRQINSILDRLNKH